MPLIYEQSTCDKCEKEGRVYGVGNTVDVMAFCKSCYIRNYEPKGAQMFAKNFRKEEYKKIQKMFKKKLRKLIEENDSDHNENTIFCE